MRKEGGVRFKNTADGERTGNRREQVILNNNRAMKEGPRKDFFE